MDGGVIIVIAIVVAITAVYSGLSTAFEMLIGLLLGWGAYCFLRWIISQFLSKKKDARSAERLRQAKQTADTPQLKPSVANLVESIINTGDNKAYFDDGVVYAITKYGEIKIGYYDDEKAYDANKREIALFTHHDDNSIFIQLNHLGKIAYLKERYDYLAENTSSPAEKESYEQAFRKESAHLRTSQCANASNAGYIEEVDGDYRNVAYLHGRSDNMPKDRVLGMAAAFVCLQSFTNDKNRYSDFYHRR